ncbi:unnamed protein product, partial [Acidithrix sp. C25]
VIFGSGYFYMLATLRKIHRAFCVLFVLVQHAASIVDAS